MGPPRRRAKCAGSRGNLDVVGEMGYNLFLEAHGDFVLEDVTREWTGALKSLPNHLVAYWTGTMVVAGRSQGPGTPYWRERFGERTRAGYFENYPRKALASGANGVFFHSLCRLDGLPPKTRGEVTTVMKQLFKEMGGR
jgi:hypothetical protein